MTRWKWEDYRTLEDLKKRLNRLKYKGNTFKIRISGNNKKPPDIDLSKNLEIFNKCCEIGRGYVIGVTNNVNEIMQIINQHGVFKDGIYQKADPIYIHQINIWLQNGRAICLEIINSKDAQKGYKEYSKENLQIAEENLKLMEKQLLELLA